MDRRTIQRWLNGPKPLLFKDPQGRVCLGDVIRLKSRNRVGRPSKKAPDGTKSPWWEVAGTPGYENALPYFGVNGPKKLRGMLACLAHHWILNKKVHELQELELHLSKALNLVSQIQQKKKDGEEWYALARRELRAILRE